jgi:hypothetical protein
VNADPYLSLSLSPDKQAKMSVIHRKDPRCRILLVVGRIYSYFFVACATTLLLVLLATGGAVAGADAPPHGTDYVMVGVSGGLQEGFPDHFRLDYRKEGPAVFVGRALVRGYRSYLDVMQPTWRQYVTEPRQPLINCNVIPTGCFHHANEYWMYLVDARQFLSVLMHEPRFLSITPDLGLVDLTAEETSPVVRHIAESQIGVQLKGDYSAVAFPIVTAAWYNVESHIPSPILYTKADGTQVTNFPQSLAIWVGYSYNGDENSIVAATSSASQSTVEDPLFAGKNGAGDAEAKKPFWDKVRASIRKAEEDRLPIETARANGPPFDCDKTARFGVTDQQARINYPLEATEIVRILASGGYAIDFVNATITSVIPDDKASKEEL